MATNLPKDDLRKGSDLGSSIKVERMENIYDKVNGQVDSPHRHQYNTVVWVQEGEGTHVIDFNEYTFGKDHIYFVGPGQIHQIKTVNRPKGWVITFHNDFVVHSGLGRDFLVNVNLFRQYSDSPPIVVPDVSQLAILIELLFQYSQQDFEYSKETQGAALKLFLIECIRYCDPENRKAKEVGSPILMEFKSLVNLNFRDIHKVGEYAELLSVTPKYLNEVIKNAIGMTAKDYIIDRILLEAKRLLLHTDESVKLIAISLGFSEPLHFNTFFKNKMHMTPLEYRKETKLKNR